MATRRPGSRQPRIRPGFGPPRRGGGIPWWGVVIGGGLLIAAVIVLSLATRTGPAPTITPSPMTATAVVTPQPTDTAIPTVTPTLVTRACTVREDTRIYRQPDDESVSQDLAAGRIVSVIDTIQRDDHVWYRMILPGYSEVLYVPVEAVECK